jgi:hypothetical protein
MTFWQILFDNKVKILGTLTTVVATLLGMIALKMFDADGTTPALLEPLTLRWWTIGLTLLNVVLGGGTTAAGFSNGTKIKVAEAQAKTATAMETAINAVPGDRV